MWSRRQLLSALAVVALAGPLAGPGAGCTGAKTPKGIQLVGNSKCPVSGNPVGGSAKAPTFHSDFKGHRVGFMCPNCKGKFDRASDAEKLSLLNKALQSVGKKPVS